MWINKGDRSPADGYLIPEVRFHDATIQMLDLKMCEQRLKDQDCSDDLSVLPVAFQAGAIGMILGFVAFVVIKPRLD